MKTFAVIIALSLFGGLLSSCKKNEVEMTHIYGEATDVENKSYVTVDIHGKMWFTENLTCKLFRNGDSITQVTTNAEWEDALYNEIPAWSYCNNDSILSETHGIIYNYYAVTDSRGLAPEGYHISTSNEWQLLIDSLGGEWSAGDHLKATEGWDDGGNGSNSTQFNALPGGCRISTGAFLGVGENGWYWTSTSVGNNSPWNYAVLLPSINNLVNIVDNYGRDYGFYVRCVKD